MFDPTGRPLASAQESFSYHTFSDPDVPMIRGFDLDPAAFWGTLARCTRQALAALPPDARILGVIATAQREGCVFLDRDGAVLYAGPNLDARAVMQGMEMQQVVSADRLHAITGHAPPYIFPVARYLWFRKHHDARRVATLFMLNDWITHLLSGSRLAEHSNASESMLYDVTRRAWSTELLEALGVPADILPPLCETGTLVGHVTSKASAATGLPKGTPVFAGGADTESALLGSGAYLAGQYAAVLGTTSPVQLVIDRPQLDADGNLWTSPHVVADRWVLESNAGDTGNAYRWLLELILGAADAEAYAAAERAMADVHPDPCAVFSHLGPAIFDLRNMNPYQPAGLLFRFPLLHIDRPNRGDVLRAFLENLAFAIRGNCEQLAAVSGVPVESLLVSGGLTQSPTLLRLIATTLGVPLAVCEVPESASLGCAMLAAIGVGLHADVPAAVAAMTRARQVAPDGDRVAAYDDRYRRWRSTYGTLREWTLS